jgi:signal transduction histidine kinase
MKTSTSRQILLEANSKNRSTAARQFAIQQLTYWMTIGGIVLTEFHRPSLSSVAFIEWIVAMTLMWLVRGGLFWFLYNKTPETVRQSLLLRLMPLMIVAIAGASWVWTVFVFSSAELSMRDLFMCIGFLNSTIAMTSMWPIAPLPVIVYDVALWGAYSYGLYSHGLASGLEVAGLNLTVFVILYLFVLTAILQLDTQVVKSTAMERLAQELAQSNAHLHAMQRQAIDRLQNRSRFFAETTHDFKQRLHAAKLIALSARVVAKDDRAMRYVDRLTTEMDQLEQFMMSFLSSARRESLGKSPTMEAIPLQSVFQQLDLQFEEQATRNNKVLHFRSTPARICTDRAMLERVIGNLVSNALQFTRSRILVAARRRENGLVIEVWDQGPGIPSHAYERIFDAYQQEGEANEWNAGVGLGLAVVKRLTRSMGYKVGLKSKLGAGTVFRITVPAQLVEYS